MKVFSRRAALRSIGATIALPFLETMAVPPATRLCCIEMVHGSAGSTAKGAAKNLWAPAATGRNFDLSPTSLSPLEPFRDYLTIVSNTDVRSADGVGANDAGADHARSSATFLTQSRPKRTEGSDVEAGTSMDQVYAQRIGHETRLPSLQLCIEAVTSGFGDHQGYARVYMDTISWATPSKPLPMIRDPRAVFDSLFGVHVDTGQQLSILDWVMDEIARLKQRLAPRDRNRLDEYLEDIREVERRIQRIEAFNKSGEPRQLPNAPAAVSDDFEEHVKLMFDLQVQAFSADVTRVVAFKMARDGSTRVYPESGITQSFHGLSHHAEREEKILQYAQLNKYHVSMLPYFFDKLKNVQEGDSNLLDRSVILYGSPMGDSNFHNHKRCPLIVAGHANGRLKGNLHVQNSDGTSMANVMLTLLHTLGADDIASFGDSTGKVDLS